MTTKDGPPQNQQQITDDGAANNAGPPMPELHHNMGLLVSLTEAQLRRLDAALQHQQDTAALLANEKQRLAKEVAAAAAAADRLAGLTARVAAVQRMVQAQQQQQQRPAPDDNGSGSSSQQQQLQLQQLQQEYSSMAAAYPEEYILYSIATAALAQVGGTCYVVVSGLHLCVPVSV